MFTIRTRVILASLVVTAVVCAALSVIVYQNYRVAVAAAFDERMVSYAERIQTEIEEQQNEGILFNPADLRLVSPEGLIHPAIRIVDTTGRPLVADSLPGGFSVPSWHDLLAHRRLFASVDLQSRPSRSLWVPVEVNDAYRYGLQVVAPLDDVERDLARLRGLFAWTIPLALLLAAAASYLLVGRAFRPLARITETLRSITGQNLERRLDVPSGNDEVRVLATTLNEMMRRVDDAMGAQKKFIADASHEIRTPLAIIRSEMEFIARRLAQDQNGDRIAAVLGEVDRLKHLTDDLLLLARLDAAHGGLPVRTVRMDEILVDCVRRMTPIAEAHGNRLELHIESALEIPGDEERLRSVVLNLIDNAIKYSPAGPSVEISLSVAGPNVRIRVQDHGQGIPDEELPLLFQRFHRGERARSLSHGSGLGLSIVRRIVELHRGTVAVESRHGSGSSVVVELPLSTA